MDFSDNIRDYSYEFDESLVATHPVADRTSSRLLVVRVDPATGSPRYQEIAFAELPAFVASEPELLQKLWVRNCSRVFWARLYAHRKSGSRHEILLIEKLEGDVWRAMIRNSAKIKLPEELTVEDSTARLTVLSADTVLFAHAEATMAAVGRVPLPPYIRRESTLADRERYQPVWAQGPARSAAAPTASLHFSEDLWRDLQARGVHSADVNLHVGLGTFEPVRVEKLSQHTLHAEAFAVENAAAQKIMQNQTGCLAIGTTACRLLESLDGHGSEVSFAKSAEALTGYTRLFIRPGFKFRRTQALLTNFHLPESTLLVLVAVFAGSLKFTQEVYRHAVAQKFRLFSYGDATLWLKT